MWPNRINKVLEGMALGQASKTATPPLTTMNSNHQNFQEGRTEDAMCGETPKSLQEWAALKINQACEFVEEKKYLMIIYGTLKLKIMFHTTGAYARLHV